MADPQPSDRELVKAVLGGDQDAYAVLVSRYQAVISRTLYWLCGDQDETEDLTQEVFVRAYFALPTHESDRPLTPWLLTIARNLCITAGRRRKREVPPEQAARQLEKATGIAPSPFAVVEREEMRELLRKAIDDLPDEFREVVLLRHLSELSYEEICEATGLPMGTVKSRLSRGRRRLARSLGHLRSRPPGGTSSAPAAPDQTRSRQQDPN